MLLALLRGYWVFLGGSWWSWYSWGAPGFFLQAATLRCYRAESACVKRLLSPIIYFRSSGSHTGAAVSSNASSIISCSFFATHNFWMLLQAPRRLEGTDPFDLTGPDLMHTTPTGPLVPMAAVRKTLERLTRLPQTCHQIIFDEAIGTHDPFKQSGLPCDTEPFSLNE